MSIITQTARLIIRQFLPEEEDVFFELMTDERLTTYLPKRTAGQVRELFKQTLADYNDNIKLTRWGVFSGDDCCFIGLAILKQIPDESQKSELGYVIHCHFKGIGMATELANAMLTYGFAEMELAEIFAVTSEANIPSQKVLQKAGLKQGPNMERGGESLSYFKITATEWLNAHKRKKILYR
jgi:ribosomal-protein-alanine N-acetyltransferase